MPHGDHEAHAKFPQRMAHNDVTMTFHTLVADWLTVTNCDWLKQVDINITCANADTRIKTFRVHPILTLRMAEGDAFFAQVFVS